MLQTQGRLFDLDQFIADCRATAKGDPTLRAVREVVARAVSEPTAVMRVLGEPKRAAVQKLYSSTELTILNLVWAPHMTFAPHNHQMWAIIGIYGGSEDNVFWRRIEGEPGGKIEDAGAKTLAEKDTVPLGRDVIHSVTNPTSRFTGAFHVYGGDFFGTKRSEWDTQTLLEGPYDVEKTLRLFEEANERWPRN
jgi:predicted metal-dependent enzyme (double-stranded beta helix superfamily)